MSKPIVFVVGTGGTIASKYDAALGGHTSAATAQDLTGAIPEVLDLADIRTVEHSNVNSALMDTATAFGLGATLRKVLSDESVAGIVVTHGTATLEETAYLMDLTVATDKPIVTRGARISTARRGTVRESLYSVWWLPRPGSRSRCSCARRRATQPAT